MKLHAQVQLPQRGVDLTLAVESGHTLALLGPNGAGKSTALAAIAGLLRPASGRIALDDRVLFSGNAFASGPSFSAFSFTNFSAAYTCWSAWFLTSISSFRRLSSSACDSASRII